MNGHRLRILVNLAILAALVFAYMHGVRVWALVIAGVLLLVAANLVEIYEKKN